MNSDILDNCHIINDRMYIKPWHLSPPIVSDSQNGMQGGLHGVLTPEIFMEYCDKYIAFIIKNKINMCVFLIGPPGNPAFPYCDPNLLAPDSYNIDPVIDPNSPTGALSSTIYLAYPEFAWGRKASWVPIIYPKKNSKTGKNIFEVIFVKEHAKTSDDIASTFLSSIASSHNNEENSIAKQLYNLHIESSNLKGLINAWYGTYSGWINGTDNTSMLTNKISSDGITGFTINGNTISIIVTSASGGFFETLQDAWSAGVVGPSSSNNDVPTDVTFESNKCKLFKYVPKPQILQGWSIVITGNAANGKIPYWYCEIQEINFSTGTVTLLNTSTNPITSSTQIDTKATLLMDFDDGKQSQSTVGYDLQYQSTYNLWGSDGFLNLTRAYNIPPDIQARLNIKNSSMDEEILIEPVNHFQLMVESFSDEIIKSNSCKYNFEKDLLNQAEVMEACRISNNEKRYVEIKEIL